MLQVRNPQEIGAVKGSKMPFSVPYNGLITVLCILSQRVLHYLVAVCKNTRRVLQELMNFAKNGWRVLQELMHLCNNSQRVLLEPVHFATTPGGFCDFNRRLLHKLLVGFAKNGADY